MNARVIYTRAPVVEGVALLVALPIRPSPEEPTGEEGKRWREENDLTAALDLIGWAREFLTPQTRQLISEGLA